MTNSKIRLISLIMCILLLLSAVLSGCAKEDTALVGGEKADGEITPDAAEEEYTYAAKRFYFPEDYEVYPNTVSVYNGKIFMYCDRIIDRETWTSEGFIFSMSVNGDKQSFEPYKNARDNSYMRMIKAAPDGSKLYLEYTYDYNAQKVEFSLTKHTPMGEEVFSIDVTRDYFPEDPLYESYQGWNARLDILDMTVDGDNNIYLLAGSGVIVLTPEGEKAFTVPLDAPSNVINIDGKVAVMYHKNFSANCVMEYVDVIAAKMDEETAINLPMTPMGDTGSFSASEKTPEDDSDYLFYLKTALGLAGVDETGTTTIIDWIDSGIDMNDIGTVMTLGGDKFFAAAYDAMYFLNKVPVKKDSEKQIIELAHIDYGSYSQLITVINNFNRASDEYKIKLVTYTPDPLAGVIASDVLDNDIKSGKVPDMFIFYSGNLAGEDALARYEKSGMLVDLYEYMDDDLRNNLLGCVKGSFEKDGKLFRVAYELAIQSPVTKAETSDMFEDWTLTKFIDTAEKLTSDGGGKRLLSESEQVYFTHYASRYITDFVDDSAGTSSFDDAVFVRFLDHLKTFTTEITPGADAEGFKDGSILLQHAGISTMTGVMTFKRNFGIDNLTDAVFVGYPSEKGNAVISTSSYGISASATQAEKDGAWEYIKFALSDETHEAVRADKIPATHSALDMSIKEIQSLDFIVYEGGGLSTNSQRWSKADIKREEANGGKQMRFTKSDGTFLTDYLNSAVTIPAVNSKIVEIVNEEASAFLNDNRSAQETANAIQSKVTAFLSESK